MSRKTIDIDYRIDLPKLPSSIPLLEVDVASYPDRSKPMRALAERLDLGELKEIETPHGMALASRRGEIEYFRGSGGLWARDAVADLKFESEERSWRGIKEVKHEDGPRFELSDEAAKALTGQAEGLIDSIGLRTSNARFVGISLEQVTQLDAKGREVQHAAGDATVKYAYESEGLPVMGAGAKTQVFMSPIDGEPTVTGMFQVWREPRGSRKVKLGSTEAALQIGLGVDPELALYAERGHGIEVEDLEFGYLTLPAFVHQTFVFPAFRVEGRVRNPKDDVDYFHFARYCHAVDPKEYARAEAYADYLVKIN